MSRDLFTFLSYDFEEDPRWNNFISSIEVGNPNDMEVAIKLRLRFYKQFLVKFKH